MPDGTKTGRPRLLIEDWLPAAAVGVECMRERGSPSALAPTTFLHVWWARRPLSASRAAVLASVLPADFPRETFERLIDLAVRMGGDAAHNLLTWDMYREVGPTDPRMQLGEATASQIADAIGVSPQLFLNLETAWRRVHVH